MLTEEHKNHNLQKLDKEYELLKKELELNKKELKKHKKFNQTLEYELEKAKAEISKV